MSKLLLTGIVESLRATLPFHNLPAMNLPHNELWRAYDRTMHALRLPLHYHRLNKPRPKPKAYDDAIQMSLAILASFALHAGTQRAIIRIEAGGTGEAVSFQPRPWEANWTAKHALQPEALWDPDHDPMTEHGHVPRVATVDMLHLARLVSLAFIRADQTLSPNVSGTATIEFNNVRIGTTWGDRINEDPPTARLIFRPYGRISQQHLPARIETLRQA